MLDLALAFKKFPTLETERLLLRPITLVVRHMG